MSGFIRYWFGTVPRRAWVDSVGFVGPHKIIYSVMVTSLGAVVAAAVFDLSGPDAWKIAVSAVSANVIGFGVVFLVELLAAPHRLHAELQFSVTQIAATAQRQLAERNAALMERSQTDPRMTMVELSEVGTHFMFLVHFENPGERISVRNDWRLTVTRSGTVIAEDVRGIFNTGTDHILEAGAPSDVHVQFQYDKTIPDKDHLTGAVFSLVGSDFRNRPLRSTYPPQRERR